MGRPEETAASFTEGLRMLEPFVQPLPQAFGELTNWLLQQYEFASQAAGLEPDTALVQSIKQSLS